MTVAVQAVEPRLRITEIFRSLQGEADTVGLPTTFVRLTGCPLRCRYCDTAYAFTGGQSMSLRQVLDEVEQLGARYVCVTGGEPLAQRDVLPLMSALCDAGYRVSIETSGALPIDAIDARVVRIVDVKTPGSGESERNRYDQLQQLRAVDQVKFVICDRADYEWSCAQVAEHQLVDRCGVLFSASHEQLPAGRLADWIVADRLPVRLQVQLHKYLWGNVPGR